MYLTVDGSQDNAITVTDNKANAITFTVKTVNEKLHRHELEFSLTSPLTKYQKEADAGGQGAGGSQQAAAAGGQGAGGSQQSAAAGGQGTGGGLDEPAIVPLEYMLEVSVNPITGRGGNAPRMGLSTNYRRTRLLLKKRNDRRISCDTKDWIKGTEAYYIQCIHPVMKGFLCVKRRNNYDRETRGGGGGGRGLTEEAKTEEKYKVCVKGSASAKRDYSKFLMLFRLLPAQPAKEQSQVQQAYDDVDSGTVQSTQTKPEKQTATATIESQQ